MTMTGPDWLDDEASGAEVQQPPRGGAGYEVLEREGSAVVIPGPHRPDRRGTKNLLVPLPAAAHKGLEAQHLSKTQSAALLIQYALDELERQGKMIRPR